MSDEGRPDPRSSRFWEIVLLIFSILGFCIGATCILLAYVNRDAVLAAVGTAGLCLGVFFAALFKVLHLTADTNEKVNRLWAEMDRIASPPEPIPEDKQCKAEGCTRMIFSSSTRLCRIHYEEKKGREG